MRRRLTSARALCTTRSSRSSSGWRTALAIVLRTRARVGLRAGGSVVGEPRRINGGLYQRWLILGAHVARCQDGRRASRAAATSPAVYPRGVSRFNAWSLLAVFGIGVFLAGLELMITATALPSILQDLAVSDQLGKPAFSELRHASWIVNGYLLAYVVAMPLAGRLADVWGARRLFLSALIVFIARLARGRPRPVDRRADRRADHPGDRRRDPRPGRDRGRVPPLRGRRPAAGARHHRRAHVPRDGRRAVPRRGDPRRPRRRERARPRRRRIRLGPRATPWRRRGAGSSTSTSRSGSSRC